MSELKDRVESIIRYTAKHYWPPEGSPVLGVEIELLEHCPDPMFSPNDRHGFRVRKVEWYADRKHKKYGLSWKTGEWVLVQQGENYAEETFLECKPRPQSHPDPACPPASPTTD
ncbi:MAG: hypothetical protein WC565_06240 [Parcubacteria group bacterium]|jgi:hypothetical protein